MIDLLKGALATALLVAGTNSACFADVLSFAQRTNPVNGTNTTYAAVPLWNNNATTLSFRTTTANDIVVFTYNAECSGINGSGWVSVRIVVDGNQVALPNASTNFAFCHSGVEAGAVRQAVLVVPAAGLHTVRVDAAAAGGSTAWTLDDSILVVEN